MEYKPWKYLTDEEKGALLLAHHEGKTIQVYAQVSDWYRWFDCTFLVWAEENMYRVKPEPVRETVTLHGTSSASSGWRKAQYSEDTHRITFDLIDGEPDCSSVKMERIK